MLYLDGKIGIVTGATGGLGFEIAKELTKNGATAIITSRKKSKLTKACNLINKNCHGFELDVSNRKSVMKFIGNVFKKFDSVDILINNAGFPFEKKIWLKKIHGISETEL